MTSLSRIAIVVVSVFLVATPVAAQDSRDVGVTLSVPTSLGLIWHASSRVAFRPEIVFGRAGSDTECCESDTTTWSFNLSALFFTSVSDNVRTYVAPRFTYGRRDASSSTESISGTTTGDTYGLAGSFGLQYSLTERLGVYGEAGLSYSRETTTSVQTGDFIIDAVRTGRTSAFGLRAALGLSWYFK